ncbi:carbonate dehydratase [Nodosilinea sp. PGN35]|uniref:hypothetical protein n=1 Tax=Nodosilinea sp. PGN35 TaxID=3020489 RepID=UPI0023B3570C|nr:hypothetical protein [Nodosilinea sp. TSF1-S3]MDF0369616.1 hypothetical protein [Nodosilinea sp. TSF1-S3]
MAVFSVRRWLIAPLALGLLCSVLMGRGAIASDPAELFSLFQPVQVSVNDSFISPLVELFGEVSVGRGVFVAGNTVVRADPETQICIGHETNLQDNILFLALHDSPTPAAPCGQISASTGERNSIAHQAIVKNSQIGNFTFVGFHAQLNNVVLEDGAFVLHGARLENVRIKRDRIVPIGAIITTQAEADALPLKTEANTEFQNEVLEVNEEFAEHYPELYESEGFAAVSGVSAAPTTSWNPTPVFPTLGDGVRLAEFVRIIGDVRLGSNSTVGERTSIRADEGAPIVIGDNAAIEDRVTFHALKGTSITIGSDLNTSDNIVFHGPLEVGNGLTIEDDAILFRSTVGDNVTIGSRAIVVGVTLTDGTVVPADSMITTQAQADALGKS